MARLTRLFSFPLDEALREALEGIKADTGAPVAYQIRRGILMWLESQGRAVERPPQRKAGRQAAKKTTRKR